MPNENDSNTPRTDTEFKLPPPRPITTAPSTPPHHKVSEEQNKPTYSQNETAKELAREFRWVEFAQLAVNALLAAVGIIALIIYHGQLKVMSSQLTQMQGNSTQTDQLIHAANIQAAASDKNASAAASFALSADGINRHTDAAVTRLKDLAKATQDSANAVAKTLEIESSPWVAETELTLVEQDPGWKHIKVKMYMSNEGTTPAMNIRTAFATAVSKERYPTRAEFTKLDALYQHVDEFPSSRGVLLPRNSYETPINDVPLTPQQTAAMRSGDYFFFVLAQIAYDDILGQQTVSSVCTRVTDGKLLACNIGNDIRRFPIKK